MPDKAIRKSHFLQRESAAPASSVTSESLFHQHALVDYFGNVWLHFAPAVFLIITTIKWLLDDNLPHKNAFLAVLFPELICLLLSSAYHLFMAQVRDYDIWLKIDVCGVFGVMLAPYWASVCVHIATFTSSGSKKHERAMRWGYYCQPFWKITVLTLYYSCAILGLVSSALAKNAFTRAAPMGMLVFVRIASLAHRWYLGTGSPLALRSLMLMELVCTVGAFINVFRVPERWLHVKQTRKRPVRKAQPLDLIGNSHNIMHILALVAMWLIYDSIAQESAFLLRGPTCQT